MISRLLLSIIYVTMPSIYRLKPYERSKITSQIKARIPLKQKSENLNVPYATVRYTKKKAETRNEAQNDLPRKGRPRKATDNEVNHTYRRLRVRDNLTWDGVLENGPNGRTQTRERLKEIDPKFRQHRRHWSPFLSPQSIKYRCQYAKNYGNDSAG